MSDDQRYREKQESEMGAASSKKTPLDPLPAEDAGPTVEAVVCKVDDLKDGEMKEVEIQDHKALLVKDNGQFYAVGPKCTHYGAPLAKGAYCNGVVRCPWHGACFNVKTGDIEDFPGLDSLPKFEVSIADGDVKVTASKKSLENTRRVKNMTCANDEDSRVFLIVGGGAAANACAETLRQEGFQGKIIMATKEKHLPYDRPKLSKALESTAEQIGLRNKDFYSVYDIDIRLEKEAEKVDTILNSVTFKDGSSIDFTKLLIATGGTPRTMTLPGVDLKNICLLRTPEEANYIAKEAKGKNVVIIGTSFIGMEVSAAVAKSAASVTMLDILEVPFQHILGVDVGKGLKKMHEDNGTKFIAKNSPKEFVGKDGKLTEVVLEDGTRLPADICIMGIGVFPTTGFLKDSGIEMDKRGFVTVDKTMKTNKPNVYAAGDIVTFPLFSAGDQQANVQHWQMAHAHGRNAALNLLDNTKEIRSVPFFWTMQFGKSLRYTGYGPGFDDIIIEGSTADLSFVAYYTKGDEVVAVGTIGRDPVAAEVSNLMLAGRKITKDEVKNDPSGWLSAALKSVRQE